MWLYQARQQATRMTDRKRDSLARNTQKCIDLLLEHILLAASSVSISVVSEGVCVCVCVFVYARARPRSCNTT